MSSDPRDAAVFDDDVFNGERFPLRARRSASNLSRIVRRGQYPPVKIIKAGEPSVNGPSRTRRVNGRTPGCDQPIEQSNG
jgi:hypothetical protein